MEEYEKSGVITWYKNLTVTNYDITGIRQVRGNIPTIINTNTN